MVLNKLCRWNDWKLYGLGRRSGVVWKWMGGRACLVLVHFVGLCYLSGQNSLQTRLLHWVWKVALHALWLVCAVDCSMVGCCCDWSVVGVCCDCSVVGNDGRGKPWFVKLVWSQFCPLLLHWVEAMLYGCGFELLLSWEWLQVASTFAIKLSCLEGDGFKMSLGNLYGEGCWATSTDWKLCRLLQHSWVVWKGMVEKWVYETSGIRHHRFRVEITKCVVIVQGSRTLGRR